jgi:predicted transcriptional regulator
MRKIQQKESGVITSVKLSNQQKELIKRCATRNKVTRSRVIREAIDFYLKS